MAEHKIKIGNVQVELFQTSRRVKQMLAAVLVLTAVALGALWFVEHRMTAKTGEYRAQAGQVAYENQVLRQSIEELGSAKGVERVAQEELGLVPKDTILIEAQVK